MSGSIISRLGDAVSSGAHDLSVRISEEVSDVYYATLADITFFFLKRDLGIDRLFPKESGGKEGHTARVRDFFVRVGEGISDTYYSAIAETTFFFLKRDAQMKLGRLFSQGSSGAGKPDNPAISGFAPPHNPQTEQRIGGLIPSNDIAPVPQPPATAQVVSAQLMVGQPYSRVPFCQAFRPPVVTPPMTCCRP